MRFEDKLLKLLNKALKSGEDFDFKEFKITIPCKYDDGSHYIIKKNGKFYLMDAMNYGETMIEENDYES